MASAIMRPPFTSMYRSNRGRSSIMTLCLLLWLEFVTPFQCNKDPKQLPMIVSSSTRSTSTMLYHDTPISRRNVLQGISTLTTASVIRPAWAAIQPAKRPLAYRVDSTTPPTLLALPTAGEQRNCLVNLGKGYGTDKDQVVVDTINLNNMLNKAVFGVIKAFSPSAKSLADASFVCFGVPSDTTPSDIDLVKDLLTTILQGRPSQQAATAFGLACLPYSTQAALDAYTVGDEDVLTRALANAGVSSNTIELYLPLIQLAKSLSLDLLALSPEVQDLQAVLSRGLQAVNPEQRSRYVIDPQGFIQLSNDPAFQLYTDRSLFKDFEPTGEEGAGNFFAQRILVHEAAATVVAQYAAKRPKSLVALVAPIADVRYLQGINGRIPRVCQYLNLQVTNNAVTTILCNPTAPETLSVTRRLRLEIGTGPDTLDYQTKIADYLWFSTMPKVNMIPRLMDY